MIIIIKTLLLPFLSVECRNLSQYDRLAPAFTSDGLKKRKNNVLPVTLSSSKTQGSILLKSKPFKGLVGHLKLIVW